MIRYIIILLFLTMAVVIFFTGTQPYYDQVKALQTNNQTLQEALVNSRELQTIRDDLLSKYNAISQDDIGRLNKMLPLKLDSGTLVTILESRVKNYGLLLKRVDVKEYKTAVDSLAVAGSPALPYKIVDLTLMVSGPYTSFLQFLPDLERSLRVLDVQTLNFSVNSSNIGLSSNIIEFNLSARAYAVVPPAVIEAINSEETTMEAKGILEMLTKLKDIKIDADFFKNEVFKSFVDFAPSLEMPKDYGRPNPFSSLEVAPAPK